MEKEEEEEDDDNDDNTFIIVILYMFRATLCSSSEGQIVLIQHLI